MAVNDQNNYCMRPLELEDINKVSAWFGHLADLARFDQSAPIPTNKTILAENWKDTLTASGHRNAYWFGVEDSSENLIGITGIEGINYINGDAVIAGFLAEASRGKGIGLLIAGALLDLAFDQLRLNRVTSYYREDNEPTVKLTKSIGFKIEGRKRSGWYSGGTYHDLVSVGMLSSEWKQARNNLVSKLSKTKTIQFGKPPWNARLWPEKLA